MRGWVRFETCNLQPPVTLWHCVGYAPPHRKWILTLCGEYWRLTRVHARSEDAASCRKEGLCRKCRRSERSHDLLAERKVR